MIGTRLILSTRDPSFGKVGPPAASDPKATVEVRESSRSTHHPKTLKLPFDFQGCFSCLTDR